MHWNHIKKGQEDYKDREQREWKSGQREGERNKWKKGMEEGIENKGKDRSTAEHTVLYPLFVIVFPWVAKVTFTVGDV